MLQSLVQEQGDKSASENEGAATKTAFRMRHEESNGRATAGLFRL